MAEPSDSPVAGRQFQGLKYLDKLLPLFDRLHDVGCPRDKAGNRKLHFDHYCAVDPPVPAQPGPPLRPGPATSHSPRAGSKVGCSGTSLGSLSEAVEVFEPQRLEAMIAQLWADVPPSRGVGKEYVHQVLTAVDGSVVKTLSSSPKRLTSATRTATRTAAGGSIPISRSTVGCHPHRSHHGIRPAAGPTRSTCYGDPCNPITATSWTAGTPSSPCGTTSSQPQAARLPHPRQ